ncbi:hypothetical protein H106_07469 [Trichophyton rubrum CBS 735.88]|nr:hypothetical protein H106_07469 [Trichophyton rubrum CBS 735.88]
MRCRPGKQQEERPNKYQSTRRTTVLSESEINYNDDSSSSRAGKEKKRKRRKEEKKKKRKATGGATAMSFSRSSVLSSLSRQRLTPSLRLSRLVSRLVVWSGRFVSFAVHLEILTLSLTSAPLLPSISSCPPPLLLLLLLLLFFLQL